MWAFLIGGFLAGFLCASRLQNSPYFCVFKWNEAENRERDWGDTLKIRKEGRVASRFLTARRQFLSPLVGTNSCMENGQSVFFSRLTRPTDVWGSRASRASDSHATRYRFLYWFWETNRLFCSLMRLAIGLILTVERSEMSKFAEGSWQGSFTVNNERGGLASKQSRISWYSRPKNKLHTCSYSGPGI